MPSSSLLNSCHLRRKFGDSAKKFQGSSCPLFRDGGELLAYITQLYCTIFIIPSRIDTLFPENKKQCTLLSMYLTFLIKILFIMQPLGRGLILNYLSLFPLHIAHHDTLYVYHELNPKFGLPPWILSICKLWRACLTLFIDMYVSLYSAFDFCPTGVRMASGSVACAGMDQLHVFELSNQPFSRQFCTGR